MARSKHHRLPLSGAAGVVYVPLFMDKFNDGVWGPGSFTRTSDVGQLTVTDTGNNTSIFGGKFRTTSFVGFENPSIQTANFVRTKGLTALFGAYDVENDRSYLRWRVGGVEQLTLETGLSIINIGGSTGPADLGGIELDAALVLDTVGGGVYSRAANTGDFILRWLDQVSSASPLPASWSAVSVGVPEIVTLDSFGVWQDPNSVLLVPTISEAAPVNAQVYTGTASAIVDMSVTAPGSLGVECGVIFRRQDASNYWRMYFDSAGAFKVDSVVAGTPTNRVNVAGVIVAGATRRMRVRMTDSNLDFYTKNGTSWTKRGATITSSVLQAYNGVVPDIGAGWTAANLRSDPTYSAAITNLLEAWLSQQT